MLTVVILGSYIISFCQTTLTPGINTMNPNMDVKNAQYPDAGTQQRNGLPPNRSDNSQSSWPNAYSNNSNTNLTISDFLKGINFDNISRNLNNETETGKMLINKYIADAEKGNEDKMLYMALTYRIYLQDQKNEIVWLDKLVIKNNDYAMMRRGDLYEDANDITNSIALYQKAVQLGNATAMVGLAEKYILHMRNEINKPVELLGAAAEKNNAEACMELANLYTGMYGKQYPLDNVKALNLYLKYLQLSDDTQNNRDVSSQRSTVMKSIATLYKNGDGVTKDNSAHRQWMKKAKLEDEKISK